MTYLRSVSHLTDIARTTVAVIIGFLLSLVIVVAVADQPTNHDVLENQQVIIDNQRVILCLLLYPGEDRTPAVIAECQSLPPEGVPNG